MKKIYNAFIVEVLIFQLKLLIWITLFYAVFSLPTFYVTMTSARRKKAVLKTVFHSASIPPSKLLIENLVWKIFSKKDSSCFQAETDKLSFSLFQPRLTYFQPTVVYGAVQFHRFPSHGVKSNLASSLPHETFC